MNNLEDKKITKSNVIVKESLTGLFIGVLLMVMMFLFVHFVLGLKAFS